jgi:hypothetical protein
MVDFKLQVKRQSDWRGHGYSDLRVVAEMQRIQIPEKSPLQRWRAKADSGKRSCAMRRG